jgi:hypothetical protein
MNIEDHINEQCEVIRNLLITKNRAYGNSVFDPINVFAKNDWETQINVRIDDKLNRIKKGKEYPEEDTILDLIGYLILLSIGRKLFS